MFICFLFFLKKKKINFHWPCWNKAKIILTRTSKNQKRCEVHDVHCGWLSMFNERDYFTCYTCGLRDNSGLGSGWLGVRSQRSQLLTAPQIWSWGQHSSHGLKCSSLSFSICLSYYPSHRWELSTSQMRWPLRGWSGTWELKRPQWHSEDLPQAQSQTERGQLRTACVIKFIHSYWI